MNVIDLIDNNFFLKKIFSHGLVGPVYIGQFGLDVGGRFSMNIHTMQRPELEVVKWGIYGQNYDVIVIRLLGYEASNIKIENWMNADFAIVDFSNEEKAIRITAREPGWALDVTVGGFVFQGCSTYIDGRMDD